MGVNIGIVGATGQVGVAMRQILLERASSGTVSYTHLTLPTKRIV